MATPARNQRATRIVGLAAVAASAIALAVAHVGVAAIVALAIAIPVFLGLAFAAPKLDELWHRGDFVRDPSLKFRSVAALKSEKQNGPVRIRITERGIEWQGRRRDPTDAVLWSAVRDVHVEPGTRGLIWSTTRATVIRQDGTELNFLISSPIEDVTRGLDEARRGPEGSGGR